MDPEILANIEEFINVVIGGFIFTILSVFGLAFGLWKQGVMFKTDKKKTIAETNKLNVEQELKTVELAEAFDRIAGIAANKAIDSQNRLVAMEKNYDMLLLKVNDQEVLIKEQAKTIKKQDDTIKMQNKHIATILEKSNKQDEEIAKLTCDIDRYRNIFSQMKERELIPLEIAAEIEDC